MGDRKRTKEELVSELAGMRERVADLKRSLALRDEAEKALKEGEARYRAMFASAKNGVIVYGPVDNGEDFIFKDLNIAAERIGRVGRDEIIGKRISEVFSDKSEYSGLVAAFQRVYGTGRPEHLPSVRYKTLYGEGWRDIFIRKLPTGDLVVTYEDITERAVAEEALKESRGVLYTVLNSIDAAVYVADMISHEVLFVNEFMKGIFGDITGQICWKAIQRDQAGPCPFCTNFMLLTPKGEPAGPVTWEYYNPRAGDWIECHDRAIRWLDGRIVRIEVATNINERKRVEEALSMARDELEHRVEERTAELQGTYDALAENERLYRNLFENASIGMFQSRLDGSGFLRINKSYATMLGYASPEEVMAIVTDTATQIHTDPQNRQDLLAALERDEWYYHEQPYFRKDGSIMIGKLAVRKVVNPDDGAPAYLEGIVEDITERKKAEKALRESEKQYRALIENAPFPAIVSSPEDDRILYANQRASELFRVSPGDTADGPLITDYYDNPGEREVLVGQLEESGFARDWQVCFRNGAGEKIWTLLSTTYTEFSGQKAVFTSLNDITDRMRSEEDLRSKSLKLEEMNIALKVLLEQREKDKSEMEERMFSNVKQLVLPYIEKLKERKMSSEQAVYVDVLESNLMAILEPFTQRLLYTHQSLTPMEIKVANLIRDGKTIKEIASIFGVSEAAINRHRQQIRNRLGLTKKKINLQTYLASMKQER